MQFWVGNGSGKSTLMKLASGLFKASDGLVMYDGVDIRQLHTNDLSRSIGIVPSGCATFFGICKRKYHDGKKGYFPR